MIEAPYEKEFVFQDGTRSKSLSELAAALERLPDKDFSSFVNSQKNDFSSWIEYVLLDKALASKIHNIHSRAATISMIKDRINELAVQDSIMRMSKNEYAAEKNKETFKKVLLEGMHETVNNDPHEKGYPAAGAHSPIHAARDGRRWFHMFSRKNLPEKKLEHIEQVSEDKHRPESELAKEINSDYKENMLWITLYVLLIIVIIGLLAYKLLVYKSLL